MDAKASLMGHHTKVCFLSNGTHKTLTKSIKILWSHICFAWTKNFKKLVVCIEAKNFTGKDDIKYLNSEPTVFYQYQIEEQAIVIKKNFKNPCHTNKV